MVTIWLLLMSSAPIGLGSMSAMEHSWRDPDRQVSGGNQTVDLQK